jgi:hypothetical protein
MPLEDWIQHCKVAQFLYDWQTIIAGFVALVAALIAVGVPEWRARTALRASLAGEIRLYFDLLSETRQILTVRKEEFRSGEQPHQRIRELVLQPPIVYSAAGTVRRRAPRSASARTCVRCRAARRRRPLTSWGL